MKEFAITLAKSEYSEWVIRHALYWIHEPFKLSSIDGAWVILFSSHEVEAETKLHQLLNDYKLREILEVQSGSTKALTDLVIAQMTSRKV